MVNSGVPLAQAYLDLEGTFADVRFQHLRVVVLGNIHRTNPHLHRSMKSPVLLRIIVEASIYEDYGSMKSPIEQVKI